MTVFHSRGKRTLISLEHFGDCRGYGNILGNATKCIVRYCSRTKQSKRFIVVYADNGRLNTKAAFSTVDYIVNASVEIVRGVLRTCWRGTPGNVCARCRDRNSAKTYKCIGDRVRRTSYGDRIKSSGYPFRYRVFFRHDNGQWSGHEV